MQVVSVNIGKARKIEAKSGESGIYKLPQDAPVTVTRNGLQGDTIVDVENHGGVDQAVYIYGIPDYEWWADELERDLPPGIFGENLTVTDLVSSDLAIGDRFQFDTILLEVTAPRIPCMTLATRMDDPKMVKRFSKAERFGAYCRVITEGTVQTGETVTHIPYSDGERISIVEQARSFLQRAPLTEEDIRRFLAVPVDIRSRRWYEEKLSEWA